MRQPNTCLRAKVGSGEKRMEDRRSERANRRNAISRLRIKYGLSEADYLKLFEAQGNKCAICTATVAPFTKHSGVDRCPESGTIRGILCNSCKYGLAYFRDNTESLMNAVFYLAAANGASDGE